MSDANRALLMCVFVTGAACVLDFIGKGKWETNSVQPCDDGIDYPIQLEVKRRKLNRTHDGFNLTFNLPEDLTETSHGVYLEVCKHVDGGCKTQFILEDKSYCNYVKKFTYDNFVKILIAAGIDPPDCPITAREVVLRNYVFDYSECENNGMYGTYTALFYVLKEQERIACTALELRFKKE